MSLERYFQEFREESERVKALMEEAAELRNYERVEERRLSRNKDTRNT